MNVVTSSLEGYAFWGIFLKPFKKTRSTCFIGYKTIQLRLMVLNPIKHCCSFFKHYIITLLISNFEKYLWHEEFRFLRNLCGDKIKISLKIIFVLGTKEPYNNSKPWLLIILLVYRHTLRYQYTSTDRLTLARFRAEALKINPYKVYLSWKLNKWGIRICFFLFFRNDKRFRNFA